MRKISDYQLYKLYKSGIFYVLKYKNQTYYSYGYSFTGYRYFRRSFQSLEPANIKNELYNLIIPLKIIELHSNMIQITYDNKYFMDTLDETI